MPRALCNKEQVVRRWRSFDPVHYALDLTPTHFIIRWRSTGRIIECWAMVGADRYRQEPTALMEIESGAMLE